MQAFGSQVLLQRPLSPQSLDEVHQTNGDLLMYGPYAHPQ